MHWLVLIPLLPLIVSRPTSPLQLHSRAIGTTAYEEWKPVEAPHPDESITMGIHLHAHDQDKVQQRINELTDPEHATYRQWLSLEDAWKLVAPNPNTVDKVVAFLQDSSILHETIQLSKDNRSITFETTISHANALFDSEYLIHEHETPHAHGPHRRLVTESYSVPSHLKRYVSFMSPGNDFSVMKRKSKFIPLSTHESDLIEKRAQPGDTGSSDKHVIAEVAGATGPPLTSDLSTCPDRFFANCFRTLHHVPSPPTSSSAIIVGTLNLRPYVSNSTNLKVGLSGIASNIDPTYLPPHIEIAVAGHPPAATGTDSFEPDMDIQIVASLIYPMTLIDYEGPDLSGPGLYLAIQQMGQQSGVPRPDVLSVSYGGTEGAGTVANYCPLTDAVVLAGTTLIASSGDGGDQDMQDPAVCPNWLSVGASQIKYGNTVTAASITSDLNKGWNYKGSGGFSAYTKAPAYKVPAIQAYNAKYQSKYAPYRNVQNGLGAPTPDISAQGKEWIIYSGQGVPTNPARYYRGGGTSASAPAVGALFGILNAQLTANGKSTVGNPLVAFYQNPSLFRDITVGDNSFGEGGTTAAAVGDWPALAGWDPATGLGTPIFDRIFNYYNNA